MYLILYKNVKRIFFSKLGLRRSNVCRESNQMVTWLGLAKNLILIHNDPNTIIYSTFLLIAYKQTSAAEL